MTVDVPPEWLADGATIEVTVPPRVTCARCDGGGCDGCGRSGALRLAATAARRFELALPRSAATCALVRLMRPLGEEAGLEQLIVELRTGAPLACRRVGDGRRIRARLSVRSAVVAVAVVVALALALVAARG
jgi:hypothetical protein